VPNDDELRARREEAHRMLNEFANRNREIAEGFRLGGNEEVQANQVGPRYEEGVDEVRLNPFDFRAVVNDVGVRLNQEPEDEEPEGVYTVALNKKSIDKAAREIFHTTPFIEYPIRHPHRGRRNLKKPPSIFPTIDFMGVEIELEFGSPEHNQIDSTGPMSKFWSQHEDHSLKLNGVEYVTSRPLRDQGLNEALSLIDPEIKKSKPYHSYRTSVHVHIDISDLTMAEIVAMYSNYLMLEEVIGYYVDPTRGTENFSQTFLHSGTAEELAQYLKIVLQKQVGRHLRREDPDQYNPRLMAPLGGDELMYTSLTPNKLLKYGTLEYRVLGGTVSVNKIKSVIRLLQRLKQYSRGGRKIVDSQEFDGFLANNNIQIVEDVFGKQTKFIANKMGRAMIVSCINTCLDQSVRFSSFFAKTYGDQ